MLRRLCFVGLLGFVGCVQPKVTLDEGPREYVAQDYETVLKRWTRSEQLIVVNELDNVLTATATYESWDFRWAYVVRYAEDYRLTVDQRRALLERELAETHKVHQFYLALYAEKHKWQDLTVERPAWIVRLVDDEGNETAPADIEVIKRPGAIELTYFPYTTPWRSAFRVSFPKIRADGRPTISRQARWFGLRFAGAQGNDVLIWEIATGPEESLARLPPRTDEACALYGTHTSSSIVPSLTRNPSLTPGSGKPCLVGRQGPYPASGVRSKLTQL